MVNRAFGAWKRRDFDFLQRNRSVVARGDVTQTTDGVRILKRELDAEYVEDSSEETTATKDGHTSPEYSHASAESAGLEDECILYQIVGMGVNAHITLGYVPFEMANALCEGVAGHMDFDSECQYSAQCDYNETVRLGNGHSPGHSQVLDMNSQHCGEPVFNGCPSLPSLICNTCIWAEVEVIPMETGRFERTLVFKSALWKHADYPARPLHHL